MNLKSALQTKILQAEEDTPFHKFILDMRLLLQFSTSLSILSTINLLVNRTKDENVHIHNGKLNSLHFMNLRLLLHFIVLRLFLKGRIDHQMYRKI